MRVVCVCLPCLFSLHTVQVAILLRSDIALARVFKGTPMHKREHPAELVTVVIFHSPGDQTPNPPFGRVLLLSVCPMLCFTSACFFLSYFHTMTGLHKYTYTSIHTHTHTYEDARPKTRPTTRHTHINTHTYMNDSVLPTDTH